VSRVYDSLVGFARFVIRRFFRKVEVTGLEYLPQDGGGILVSWHPNGLIDPVLILAHFPRQVIFGARHGLFRWPVLGQLMKAAGTVPIYRAIDASSLDPEARRAANTSSLDALANQVALGSFSCLFPEGDSHDSPHLLELKSGAARFYYRARQLGAGSEENPVIIPVGLHYDNKKAFRSNALVAFHPPLALDEFLERVPDEDTEPPEAFRERVSRLTAEIDRTLREVVHATESWEIHHLMHRVRKLARSERAARAGASLSKPDIAERTLAFARVWAGYYTRLESHPEAVADLRAKVTTYNDEMRALGVEDHELDDPPSLVNGWLIALLLLQVVLVFLVLPPVILVGALVNGPPALLLWALSKVASKRKKDEATVKVFVGMVAFPMAWVGVGVLAALAHEAVVEAWPVVPDTPIAVFLAASGLSLLGGMLSLRYLHVVRETAHAVRVRLTRARARVTIARLRVERSELYNEVVALVGELDLPGAVRADGTVVPEDDPEAVYI